MYHQTKTPLYVAFFSEYNMNVIQEAIISKTYEQTKQTISKQDARPLTIIMESVYSVNSANPYGNIQQQIKFMNQRVVVECVRQTTMGVSAYARYINDISTTPIPLGNPTFISSVGNKIPFNSKIGI